MLGINIKDRREYYGMSRQELADKVGCSAQTIFKIEKGEADPCIDNLVKIAAALECRVDYLLDKTNKIECKKAPDLDYGKKLAEIRKKKKMSRRDVCEKAGVSSFVLQEAENKSKPLWTRNFEAVCDALEISVDWLFGRKEKMEI